jgi:hypothetical protein
MPELAPAFVLPRYGLIGAVYNRPAREIKAFPIIVRAESGGSTVQDHRMRIALGSRFNYRLPR